MNFFEKRCSGSIRTRTVLWGGALAAAFFIFLFSANILYAQSAALPAGVTEEGAKTALADLSQATGVDVNRWEQAAALCNQSDYFEACAAVGKRNNLYKEGERQQVDSLLTELKGETIKQLNSCADESCVVQVANDLAKSLAIRAPKVAQALDLTPQKVQEKKVIVDTAKEIGVSIEACRTMDPDTAEVSLLRSCARLAKDQRVQKYIPEQTKQAAGKADASVVLRERLASGQYQCGDNTVNGCSNFCLNPNQAAKEEGAAVIPAVCRQIASDVFGDEGIKQLEASYSTVQKVAEVYAREAEQVLFKTTDGRTLTNLSEIGRYLEQEGQRGNVEAVEKGMNFLVGRGLVKAADRDFALQMIERVREQGQPIDFNRCQANPAECQNFVPEEHRSEFEAGRQVEEIMKTELASRGVNDPRFCGSSSETNASCLAAAQAALPRLEEIANQSPAAANLVNGIRQQLSFGQQGLEARRQMEEKLKTSQGLVIGDKMFQNVAQVEEFCRQDAQTCLAETARQGFIDQDFAKEKYQRVFEAQLPPIDNNYQNPNYPAPNYPAANLPANLNKEEALKRFSEWLDNPQGPPPLPTANYSNQYPSQYQNVYRNPATIYPPGAPQSMPTPCPAGQYRQESRDNSGFVRYGQCIPIATPTLAPPADQRTAVCPALLTVESCPADQERVPSFSSPECGTYYTCAPRNQNQRQDQILPVPPEPPATINCSRYGSDWRSVDSSGNCFNAAMTAYRAPDGTAYACSTRAVFGCSAQAPSTVFSREYRGGLFFTDAWFGCMTRLGSASDATRIQELLSAGQMPWNSISAKGQQDTATCEQEAGSGGNQNYPPATNSNSRWTNHQWTFLDNQVQSSYILSQSGLPTGVTLEQYNSYISSIDTEARRNYFGGWRVNAGNDTDWQAFGIPVISPTAPPAPVPYQQTASSSGSSSSNRWVNHDWVFQDNTRQNSYILSNSALPPGVTVEQYNRHIADIDARTVAGYFGGWQPNAGNDTNWQEFGIPVISASAPTNNYSTNNYSSGSSYAGDANSCPGFAYSVWADGQRICRLNSERSCSTTYPAYLEQTNYSAGNCPASLTDYPSGSNNNNYSSGNTGTVSGSCSSELIGLLGSGCHSMSQAWFNSEMNSYVLPGTSAVVSCSMTNIEGCSSYSSGNYSSGSSCSSGQYWNGSACVNSSYSSDPATACGQAGGSWDSNSSYCQMPNSGGSSSCSSGQYWNGSSCVTSPPSCSSGQYWDGSACVNSQNNYSSDPAAGCSQAGGTWDAGQNYCQMPNSGGQNYSQDPSAACSQAGGNWDGSSCQMPNQDPAAACSQAGGNWDGSSCQMSFNTQSFCPSDLAWNGQNCVTAHYARTASIFRVITDVFVNLFR